MTSIDLHRIERTGLCAHHLPLGHFSGDLHLPSQQPSFTPDPSHGGSHPLNLHTLGLDILPLPHPNHPNPFPDKLPS